MGYSIKLLVSVDENDEHVTPEIEKAYTDNEKTITNLPLITIWINISFELSTIWNLLGKWQNNIYELFSIRKL